MGDASGHERISRLCVAQTKPREEELAVANLRRQDFEVFMPLLRERRGMEAKIVPMFHGYIFVAIGPKTPFWGKGKGPGRPGWSSTQAPH
jgi:Transcription termination factor nusG